MLSERAAFTTLPGLELAAADELRRLLVAASLIVKGAKLDAQVIALLHEIPRIATCVARSDAELYELERQVFVSAVSGNEQSHATIEGVVAGRLDELEGIRMS